MSYQREIILNTFQDLIFKEFGKNPDSIYNLRADASERKIFRIIVDGSSLIGVYNNNISENLAFINFTKTFIDLGFNVPEIVRVSDDGLVYLEEDLGDITLFSLISGSPSEQHSGYYKQALADLVKFQVEAGNKIDYKYCYQTNEFNIDVIESDIRKLFDYFSKTSYGNSIDGKMLKSVKDYSDDVLKSVRSGFFLYRDFQPRNIMIKQNEFYYIDYQSGRKGPLQYDAASFLYSGSISITENERDILLSFYIEELKKYIDITEEEFMKHFHFFVFIRLLQMIGSYSYLYISRKDTKVISKIPKAFENLKTLKGKLGSRTMDNIITKLTA